MGEDDIVAGLCQLGCAVIEEDIGDEGERIGLVHLHVAEGIKGVVTLEIEGTVTGEDDIIVAEPHIAYQNLCIPLDTLVVVELVGMKKVDEGALGARRRAT